ncbi:MAG: hypothetical protein JJT94_04085 [Bernardetiaceae bacterium]|nr:hypothetical protein [Bernardetiaceae bacterium]
MKKPSNYQNQNQKLIARLVSFIDTALKNFTSSDDYLEQYVNNSEANENTLTSALRYYLDIRSRAELSAILLFGSQEQQKSSNSGKGSKRTVDIAIKTAHSKGYWIYCLEAKWIDANDYVTTNTGAIKRFKKCEHGLSSENPNNAIPLVENGIVAYIKTDIAHINFLSKINSNIKKLANQYHLKKDKFGLNWQKAEILTANPPSQSNKYISQHVRIDNSNLILHHFWVEVDIP